MYCFFFLFVLINIATVTANYLHAVPSVPFSSDNRQSFRLRSLKHIVVDSSFADEVNTNGSTLIPPTLWEFASTFQLDVKNELGLQLRLAIGKNPAPDAIFLTLDKNQVFKDAAGILTSEGYSLTVDRNGIVIAGASPLGAWWGTRSIMQLAQLYDCRLPCGSGTDAPGWRTRGIMLDAGRHYYPPDFIIELCSYLSFFKQNELHLHVSDNLFINLEQTAASEIMNTYGSFRLSSDNPALNGLGGPQNESYTHDQFEAIQQRCAKRGVSVIPEIEAPAHALAITRWKPELALSSDPTMLNVSHPGTLPLLREIWGTFLPWFHSKEVHIGADEYSADHIPDYVKYVNELSSFIQETSSKRTRIWGTFTPSQGSTVSKDITIQHWAPYSDNAYHDFIANGYETINSDYMFYMVGKWSPYFGQRLNKTLIFSADPLGGPFAPHIFDAANATNNPPRDNPFVVGHISPFWSDWGPTATTFLEAYYSWRDSLPALADKQWGGSLLETEYDSIIDTLRYIIPDQNLDRRVESRTALVLKYPLNKSHVGKVIKDHSGNNYHGILKGDCNAGENGLYFAGKCHLDTPLHSLGRNYTLSFEVKPTSSGPATLFAGADSTLMSQTAQSELVTIISGSHPYAINYTLPLNRWIRVELAGRGESTFLKVSTVPVTDDKRQVTQEFEFLTRIDTHGVQAGSNYTTVWRPMAFEAPLARIGEGFKGYFRQIVVRKNQ
ncbi:glycoside hydrolase [Aspergillus pseudoustus]|uniref:beta-N-acetylhexosaminidase n=1 Tax=Aspergillus pseudoustus TaxID=1810923 RepID=A0ABR4JDY0_9EURO